MVLGKKLFQRKKSNTQFAGQYQDNMGFYEGTKLTAVRTIFRAKVPAIEKWKYLRTDAGATFFKLPNGSKIAIKPIPHPLHFNKVEVRNGVRDYSKILERITRKKIRFETPLGRIITKDGRWYYVTKAIEGKNLDTWLKQATNLEGVKLASNIGLYLADMHKKGVSHTSVTPNNWIINGTKPTLIDAKYVMFKEEYPWGPRTAPSKYTWENHTKECAESVARILPEKLRPLFWDAYNKK